jgi:glycerol-3-phosphate acyltransferase PlsY
MDLLISFIDKQIHLRGSESLGFWTCPLSRIINTRKHDVSEAGSVSVLRRGGVGYTYSVGTLRKS